MNNGLLITSQKFPHLLTYTKRYRPLYESWRRAPSRARPWSRSEASARLMRAALYQSLTRAAPCQDARAASDAASKGLGGWRHLCTRQDSGNSVALISQKQFTPPARRRRGSGVIRR